MHETAQRLFDAIKSYTDGSVDGFNEPGKLASYLGESPAVLNNWKNRGVSKQGLLKASTIAGINTTWISTGEGPTFVGGDAPMNGRVINDTRLDAIIKGLADALNQVDAPEALNAISECLKTLTFAPDSAKARQALVILIGQHMRKT